eukprot:15260249-Alexandrium_andersonii.AAC.1
MSKTPRPRIPQSCGPPSLTFKETELSFRRCLEASLVKGARAAPCAPGGLPPPCAPSSSKEP